MEHPGPILAIVRARPKPLPPLCLPCAIDPAAAPPPWSLSRPLLQAVLDDRLSDRFVCELIWWRLGYRPVAADGGAGPQPAAWRATPATPAAWAERFPGAPELVAERPANVQLTRSIPAPFKQLLKEQLGFGGYRIGELYPRRTRRAVAVNWLLAHLAGQGEPLADSGPLPPLLDSPPDPVVGHPGDRPVA
mgnify:FL=1